jgi:hypothetical protein
MLQRPEKKTALSTRQRTDASTAILIVMILGLVSAVLVLRSPENARLTPEQVSQMPLWGP